MTDEERALIARLPADSLERNGVPDEATRARRERAAVLAREVLADVAVSNGFRWSPCGPGWSTDLDVHMRELPDSTRLLEAGWLPLDGLLKRLRSSATGRWAIRENGTTLAGADLHLDPPPDALATVLARARRRGEVRAREILELRRLAASGSTLPEDDDVVVAAAAGEAALGGSVLAPYRGRGQACPPVALRARSGRALRRGFGALRGRQVNVAFSGVDGAGKSSLAGAVAAELQSAGIPVTIVWARPGMHIEFLRKPAGWARRLLGHRPEPGLRTVATGRGDTFASRRGALGWLWSTFITAAFLVDVHRQQLPSKGVVLYDRHQADALATLELAYPDTNRRLQEALVRLLLPRPDMTFYVEIDADTAVARKPDEVFGERAVRSQLERYATLVARMPRLTVIDGRAPRAAQLDAVLSQLLAP